VLGEAGLQHQLSMPWGEALQTPSPNISLRPRQKPLQRKNIRFSLKLKSEARPTRLTRGSLPSITRPGIAREKPARSFVIVNGWGFDWRRRGHPATKARPDRIRLNNYRGGVPGASDCVLGQHGCADFSPERFFPKPGSLFVTHAAELWPHRRKIPKPASHLVCLFLTSSSWSTRSTGHQRSRRTGLSLSQTYVATQGGSTVPARHPMGLVLR